MNMRIVFAFLAVLVVLSAPALAIGIGPGRIEVKFEPSMNATYEVQVINTEDSTEEVQPFVSGDLQNYITMDKTPIKLAPGEAKKFTFSVSMPASLTPGRHDTNIGVVGMPPSGAMVGAVAGAEIQFWVYVDYPQKYIAIETIYTRPFIGQQMFINVTLINPVNSTITASADLEIDEIKNNSIMLDRVDFGSLSLLSGETRTFQANFTPPEAADYSMVSRAYYDGGPTKSEVGFTLTAPGAPVQPSAPTETPAPITAADMWKSPYTYVIIILVLIILAVLVWPEKRRGKDGAR
jgi:hypothetical protein